MSDSHNDALLAAFATTSSADISDNLERQPGAVGLKPFHRCTGSMAGRAFTVRTRSGDNLFIHQALTAIRPGDVLVVDGGGDISRALVGDIMVAVAQSRGAAGFVIDGAIRDAATIQAGDFPVFARAAFHRGPYKNGPGALNVPVSIGGMIVHPGDFVVGDADGVVAFAPDRAAALLDAVRAQEAREAAIKADIAAGRYADTYGKPEQA